MKTIQVLQMMTLRKRRAVSATQQGGAAALIVVMVLFFIISMVAAYTSRNLIFEQRTAANQYRATQAFEAAEAGIQWALGQLNAGRMDGTSCAPTANSGTTTVDLSFRERYLQHIDAATGSPVPGIDPSTGAMAPRPAAGGGAVVPSCTFSPSTAAWACYCPQQDTATTAPAAPTSTEPTPAFIVRMAVGTRPDLIDIETASCTRPSPDCLKFAASGSTGDGVANLHALAALRGAVTRIPAGALTMSGSLGALPSTAILNLKNEDPVSGGVTVHAGGTIPSTGVNLTGLPGTPPDRTSALSDSSLQPLASAPAGLTDVDRRFASFFGMTPTTYLQQPGLPILDQVAGGSARPCGSPCSSATLNAWMVRNPGRPIWLTGSTGVLTIDANIGTDAAPALIITEGDVSIANGVTVKGLIYGRKPNWTWTAAGSATVQGAVIAEGGMTIAGAGTSTSITYDAILLKALRVSYGTFVRVPGGWKDF